MKVADAHCIVWFIESDKRLSSRAAMVMQEGLLRGGIYIADISLSEISQLIYRGRLVTDWPVLTYLEFIESRFRVLPITAAIAARAHSFTDVYPKDPADRLIGATALVYGAELITADTLIRASGEVPCIW